MSDKIPNGLTKQLSSSDKILLSIESYLSIAHEDDKRSLTKLSDQFKETKKNYDLLLKSVDDQIVYLKESGMNSKQIEEYLKSIDPLLKSQTEKYTEEAENVQKKLTKIYDETKFSSIQEQTLAKETIDSITKQTEHLKNDAKEKTSLFGMLGEKFSSVSKTMYDKTFNSFLGQFQLITAPIEELTGLNFKEMTAGLFGKAKGFITGTKEEKVQPKRSELLKWGATGAAAVWITDTLGKKLGIEQDKDEGFISALLKKTGITSLLTTLGSIGLIAGPALAGIAAFTALKWDDITDSFSLFGEGKVGKGIESLLIGSSERVTEENAGKGIKKQATAYGLGTLGVATTAGAASTVAGMGGIAAAGGLSGVAGIVGSSLSAAFPPALIALGVAGMAKGIQSAWVLEWDKKAESASEEVKSVFKDEESTWLEKSKAGIVYFGKAYFGSLAGGLKETVDKISDKNSKISKIWKDQNKSFLAKTGEITSIAINGILMAPIDFLKGSWKTMSSYIWNLLPTGLQDSIGGFFDQIAEIDYKEIMTDTFNFIKEKIFGFFTGFKDIIGNFFGGVKDFFSGNRSEVEDGSYDPLNAMYTVPGTPTTTVDDAIIKKDGTVIKTSPDDNLIASKNEPRIIESSVDKQVSREIRETTELSNKDYTSHFDSMINLLQVIAGNSKSSGNNIIQNTISKNFDFDTLRFGET